MPNRIVVENVLDGSRTTLLISNREKRDLPDEIFDPEGFGVDSPCVP